MTSFKPQPDSVYCCRVNAHRQGWNGTICKNPMLWKCSAKPEFRESYCEKGNGRCHHIHTFEENAPSFTIDDNGGSWVFKEDPTILENQVVVIYGPSFQEPAGVKDPARDWIYGVYVAGVAEEQERHWLSHWTLRPKGEHWARFEFLKLELPRFEGLTGPYLKRIDSTTFIGILDRAKAKFADDKTIAWPSPDHKRRFDVMASNIRVHVQNATKVAKGRVRSVPLLSAAVPPKPVESKVIPAKAVHQGISVAETAKSIDVPLLDEKTCVRIQERHGEEALRTVLLGFATKPLLILQGHPGSGKSDLAQTILPPENLDRSIVIPVSSTWRGREDLLGYVSPIDNQFQATDFTNFLRRAAVDYEANGRTPWYVVLEEFNLSQPEHWFSDILVCSQHKPEQRAARTIRLGGSGVRDWPAGTAPRVFLAPTVRFIATLNTDHTVRTLSPRVLDRACTYTMSVQPKEAIRRVGRVLSEDLVLAIENLDLELRRKGPAFTLRTAVSIDACLKVSQLKLSPEQAVDLVLTREVLPKVSLLSSDPADLDLLDGLEKWVEDYGKNLLECSKTIADWRASLDAGRDIQQP